MTKRFTRETLIEKLLQVKADVGGRVGYRLIVSAGLRNHCVRLFGSVENARIAAGINEPYIPPIVIKKVAVPKPAVFKPWKATRAEIVERLASLYKELGREFSAEELKAKTGIRRSRVLRVVEPTWAQALNAAGVPCASKQSVPKEELLSDLQRVAIELGGAPSLNAYKALGKYSTATFKKYFGYWADTLAAAGLGDQSTVVGASSEREREIRKRWKDKEKAKRRQRLDALLELAPKLPVEGSKTQAALSRLVCQTLEALGIPAADMQVEASPHWLKNPLTGYPLRLDAFFEVIGLAFEYQSEYHFCYRNEDKDRFEESLLRDYNKRQLLLSRGVFLLEVAYFEPHTEAYIAKKLAPFIAQYKEKHNARETWRASEAA